MPRQLRDLGETGWAHIVIRGINRENLFYDREDYERFSSTLFRFLQETEAEVAAFCLMSNHVHLLLYEKNNAHSQILKKVLVSYAAYYNQKYERVGHVFQDRFRSEPIDDGRHLLNVIRYIYQNPQKAGICNAAEYPYTQIDTKSIPSEYLSSPEEWQEFLDISNDDSFLDYDSRKRYDDSEAMRIIESITGDSNPQRIQGVERTQRDLILRQLKDQGLSVRQIARLTGLNRNMVQRI